jgi:hypothetical protein
MPTNHKAITNRFHSNHLVVDLKSLGLVQQELKSMRVVAKVKEQDKRLRLALLKLETEGPDPGETTEDSGDTKLGQLMFDLQKSFRAKYGGWAPVMGKDRLVGVVEGSPYTGGGQDVPQPYTGGGEGVPQPYTGGGEGAPQPYTGGDEGAPRQTQFPGGFPRRADSPKRRIAVGILDTRLFPHQDLVGRYLAGQDAIVPQDTRTPPTEAHATFIAGVVLQWAPNADLIVDHVLDEKDNASSSWDVATKMAAFLDSGVNVLNISFGTTTLDSKPPLILSRAIEVLAPTVTIVAAAGNHWPDRRPIWPAAFGNVTAVGATTRVDGTGGFRPAAFSPRLPWVNLVAPGVYLLSTYKTKDYATWSGTSFAAAGVSGAIAYLVENQGITPAAAVDLLLTPPSARQRTIGPTNIKDIRPALGKPLRELQPRFTACPRWPAERWVCEMTSQLRFWSPAPWRATKRAWMR